MCVLHIPLCRSRQAFGKADFWRVTESSQLGDLRTAARCGTFGRRSGNKLDFAAEDGRRLAGQGGNGDFVARSDVVDFSMFASIKQDFEAVREIVDIYERPSFVARAEHAESDRARLMLAKDVHPHDELRNHVLPTHVGTVDVVRSKYDHPLEMRARRN